MVFLSHVNWSLVMHLAIPALAFTYAYYAWRTKIPLVSSRGVARQAMINVVREVIQRNPQRKTKIYDLGSGLGGLCLTLAKEFPDAEVVGIEMGWPIWLLSVLRQKLSRQKNVRFLCGNFWKRNIADGNIIIFYLGDVLMPPMSDKLHAEPCAGRTIISNTFPLPKDWVPDQRIAIDGWLSKEILVYRQM